MKKHLVLSLISVFALATSAWSASGLVQLKETSDGSTTNSTVKLVDTPEGLKIDVQLENFPAGQHGFHIHEFGDCSDHGSAAGSHFNPNGLPHGNLLKDGMTKAHAGDFGNITVGADGKGHMTATIKGLTLEEGKFSVAGRAFIVHANPDDFSQPTGNAGGRTACGAIVLVKPAP